MDLRDGAWVQSSKLQAKHEAPPTHTPWRITSMPPLLRFVRLT